MEQNQVLFQAQRDVQATGGMILPLLPNAILRGAAARDDFA